MIGIFKQKSPVNIVLLLITGLLIKMPVFLYVKPVQRAQTDGVLYNSIAGFFGGENLLATIAAFGLLYVQAFLLNYLVNNFNLTAKPTYLPAMSYLLLTSLLPEWNYFSAPLLASTLIIYAFIQLFKIYNSPKAKEGIYNAGLLTGISSFIFFPALSVVACFLIGILTLRPFKLNELLLLIIGALTPFYFYAAYLFLTGPFNIHTLFPYIQVQVPKIKNTGWLFVDAGLLVLPFLLGGYFIQKHLRRLVIQVRKNWGLVFFYILLTAFVPFINTASSFCNWILIVMPFACFHSYAYLYATRKWVPLTIFFSIIAIILIQQYGTPLWH